MSKVENTYLHKKVRHIETGEVGLITSVGWIRGMSGLLLGTPMMMKLDKEFIPKGLKAYRRIVEPEDVELI